MPKPGFPWPAGSFVSPFWRGRHKFTADTIPPSYPAGPASAATRVPYLETSPVTTDGAYDSESRALGLHEPVTSPVVNRGLVGVQEAVDMLREKDDAVPLQTFEAGVAAPPPGPPYKVDLSVWLNVPLVYLGPEGTSAFPGLSPYVECSNYIKLWDAATQAPLRDVFTGAVLDVVNVTSAAAGGSLYAALPAEVQVYPRGAAGVINTVVVAGLVSTLTFTGGGGAGAPPDGTPAPPGSIVCFFNYNHWQRRVRDGGDELEAFAICTTSVVGPPAVYTLNRDVTALAVPWAPGDHVYTTHFAWGPTLNMSAELAATDSVLLHLTFASAGFGPTERFAASLFGLGTAAIEVPLELTDPPSGTQYSWDRLNALFRALDMPMAGSVGFDHETGETVRPHAGFLHRTQLAFNNAATTVLAVGEVCGFNQPAGLVTLGGGHFHGGAGVTATHLIPGVDLLELVSPAGLRAVFLLENITGAMTCTVRCLDGSVPPVTFPTFVGGAVTAYRPSFRTGGFTNPGNIPAGYPAWVGLVAVGDYSATSYGPALTLLSGGYRYLQEGYCYPGDTRQGGIGTGVGLGPVFGIGVDPMPTPTHAFFEYGAHGLDHALGTPADGSAMHRVVAQADVIAVNVQRTRSRLMSMHTWDEDPEFVHEVRSASGLPDQVDRTSFRISPNAPGGAPFGLSKTGVAGDILYTASLYLGDPGTAPTVPNYARVVAGPYGGAPSTRAYCGLVVHRDGEIEDDRIAWVVEGDPVGPPVIPDRFQINNTMEFAWSAARTFYHHVVMADGLPVENNPAVSPWIYWTDRPVTNDPVEYVRWTMANGAVNDADVVDFPFNLPQGAVITLVEVLYGSTGWVGGGASRVFYADLYSQTANWAAPAAPTKSLSALRDATMAGGFEVVPITPSAWNTIDNQLSQYWVRIRSAYDANAGLSTQVVAAIRITYTLQDFRPA